MKSKIFVLSALTGLLSLPFGVTPKAVTSNETVRTTSQCVVAISPFLGRKTAILSELITWSIRQTNADFCFYDAWEGKKITQFLVPSLRHFSEEAALNGLRTQVKQLDVWSQLPSDKKYDGSGAMRLPLLLNRISQNLNAGSRLIIIGSPVGRGPEQELDFATLETPAIETLKKKDSAFFVSGWKEGLSRHDLSVDWVFPDEDTTKWPTKLEKDLKNLWGAFFACRGGDLMTFSPDLSTAFHPSRPLGTPMQDFASLLNEKTPIVAQEDPTPASEPTPSTPSSRTNSVAYVPSPSRELSPTNTASADQIAIVTKPKDSVPADLTETAKGETNSAPPIVVRALSGLERAKQRISLLPAPAVAVGIYYQNETAQGEIRIKPTRQSDEIWYLAPSSSLGSYASDFDYESRQHTKWVYFPAGLDVSKAVVWLNYSAGVGRLTGKLFWIGAKSEAEMPFSFRCVEGGDPKRKWRRGSSEHWTQMNLLDLVPEKSSDSLPLSNGPHEATSSEAHVTVNPLSQR